MKTVTFLSPLRLEAMVPDQKRWRVAEDFKVSINSDGLVGDLTVPAGFITDLASVPRLPLVYWLVGGRARMSAVLHDFLYTRQVAKDYADSVFYAAMHAEGVRQPYAWLMYQAVKNFGLPAYESKKERADSAEPGSP